MAYVNMTPPHPGDFIRTEVIEEMGLSVEKAAQTLVFVGRHFPSC